MNVMVTELHKCSGFQVVGAWVIIMSLTKLKLRRALELCAFGGTHHGNRLSHLPGLE